MNQNTIKPGMTHKTSIQDASELFPYCNRQFACGVHSQIKGESVPIRPESDEFIQGYYQSEILNLSEKYKLNRS